MKTRLQTQYKDIAERIISMALESVDYAEDKACRILDIVIQEDKEIKMKSTETNKKKDNVEKNVSFKEIRYEILNHILSGCSVKLRIICVEVQVCVTLLIPTKYLKQKTILLCAP